MKKSIIFVLAIVCMLGLTGCGEEPIENAVFRATILDICDGYFLVEPIEGSTESNSADQITVPMKHMSPSPEPDIGDIIEIVYNGEIAESYPAQITEVYSIKVIEDIE